MEATLIRCAPAASCLRYVNLALLTIIRVRFFFCLLAEIKVKDRVTSHDRDTFTLHHSANAEGNKCNYAASSCETSAL